MYSPKIAKILIEPSFTILQALKRMDEIEKKILLIVNNQEYVGLISIGDIQRAILNEYDLRDNVVNVIRKNSLVAKIDDKIESIKTMMLKHRMEICPVIDSNKIVDVYFWDDLFENSKSILKNKFNLPIVIMAGGIGSRLKPLTNVLPKPLIPIKDKTMLEEIFHRFSKYGSKRFYISTNYKSDLIEYYLDDKKLPFDIKYFKEKKPMGTAGSLSLLKSKINETFFVTNCDILIDEDYSEILDYHRTNKNDITIVAGLKHYPISYGTVKTGSKGKLIKFIEKPEVTFKINSGMYILEPSLLSKIPKNKFFHITELIDSIKKENGNIGVYPVSEKSWKDIGQWDDFLKLALNKS